MSAAGEIATACGNCGDALPPYPGRGRRREFCGTCRPLRNAASNARRHRNGYQPRPLRTHRCAVCLGSFETRRSNQRYCTARCKNARVRMDRAETAACKNCGDVFQRRPGGRAKVYCSTRCHSDAKIFGQLAHATCTVPWQSCRCGVPYIARQAASRCAECSRPVEPRGPVCRLTERPQDNKRVFVNGPCSRCGTPFMGLTYHRSRPPHSCSLSCDRAIGKERRRARKRKAFVARVYRQDIYARDGWRCQLCRKPVNREASVPERDAPTLDHIIPLSLGGTHEPSNVQLAHFSCNSKKGNRLGGDQLLLVG